MAEQSNQKDREAEFGINRSLPEASDTTTSFMYALQEAESTGNSEALEKMFSDEAEVTGVADTEPQRGQEGVHHFWHAYLNQFKEIRSRFMGVVEGDHCAALEWRSEGTLASGKPIDYEGVSVIRYRSGRIHSFKTYFDTAAFIRAKAETRAAS